MGWISCGLCWWFCVVCVLLCWVWVWGWWCILGLLCVWWWLCSWWICVFVWVVVVGLGSIGSVCDCLVCMVWGKLLGDWCVGGCWLGSWVVVWCCGCWGLFVILVCCCWMFSLMRVGVFVFVCLFWIFICIFVLMMCGRWCSGVWIGFLFVVVVFGIVGRWGLCRLVLVWEWVVGLLFGCFLGVCCGRWGWFGLCWSWWCGCLVLGWWWFLDSGCESCVVVVLWCVV